MNLSGASLCRSSLRNGPNKGTSPRPSWRGCPRLVGFSVLPACLKRVGARATVPFETVGAHFFCALTQEKTAENRSDSENETTRRSGPEVGSCWVAPPDRTQTKRTEQEAGQPPLRVRYS